MQIPCFTLNTPKVVGRQMIVEFPSDEKNIPYLGMRPLFAEFSQVSSHLNALGDSEGAQAPISSGLWGEITEKFREVKSKDSSENTGRKVICTAAYPVLCFSACCLSGPVFLTEASLYLWYKNNGWAEILSHCSLLPLSGCRAFAEDH